MKEEKGDAQSKKELQRNAGGRGITHYIPEYKIAGSLFKRAIVRYTYQRVVMYGTKIPAKMPKFDVPMDETFLPEEIEDMRFVKVTTRIFPLHKFNNYHLHAYN